MNITKVQNLSVALPTFKFENEEVNVSIRKHGVTLGFAGKCQRLQNDPNGDRLLAEELVNVIDSWDLTWNPYADDEDSAKAEIVEPFPITADNLQHNIGIEFITMLIDAIMLVTSGNAPTPETSKNGSVVSGNTANPIQSIS